MERSGEVDRRFAWRVSLRNFSPARFVPDYRESFRDWLVYRPHGIVAGRRGPVVGDAAAGGALGTASAGSTSSKPDHQPFAIVERHVRRLANT